MEDFCKHSLKSIIAPDNITCVFKSNMSYLYAMIDTDQMMQVLNNLEKNAIEAMPDGGQLTIELNGDDESVEINISDNGSGISKNNMDKIFTPFFTTKEMGKGTGLGLPLVYGIVKMHRGQIIVTSNDEKETGPTGTNFKIILPRNIINK
jgi:signal transduction histidine kinase